MFTSASLARRIERAEVALIGDGAASTATGPQPREVFVRHVCGGIAVHARPGSPLNKVAGLGFDGVPDRSALDEIEEAFDKRGSPVQVELSTLGEPAIARLLTKRGYELVGFENVLGRRLDGSLDAAANRPVDPALSIASTAERDEWIDTVLTGFLNPDTFDGPASHETFDADVLRVVYDDMARSTGYERYLARIDGKAAGGASLRLFEGVAHLCGAATLPPFRRRGIQSALLRHRLLDARGRACDVAVVTTQPGSKSQQNVQNAGFQLLYARAILVKSSRS
jgi:ribosomal protein S18 acetylase RimI-like enzyme